MTRKTSKKKGGMDDDELSAWLYASERSGLTFHDTETDADDDNDKRTDDYQKLTGFKFPPSEDQRRLFDFIVHGHGNAVLKACAGSGKTTTLVGALRLVDPSLKTLFLAFNRDIVEELRERIGNLDNVTVSTVHSLGLTMIRKNFPGFEIEIDAYKYKTYIRKNLEALAGENLMSMPKRTRAAYADNVKTLVDLGRCYLAQTAAEMESIADEYCVDLEADEADAAVRALAWGKENPTVIDYGDMVWLPYELNLNPKGLRFDFVFVDECQDISDVQRELFLRCFKRGTRFVACGDPAQAIYGFNGANAKSFQRLQSMPNTVTLPLSTTYRCPVDVVDYVNTLVPDIRPRDNAPKGVIVKNVLTKNVEDDAMILCRNRAPLFKIYNKMLNQGRKAYMRGKDIGMNLVAMIENTGMDALNVDRRADGVFVRLYKDLFDKRNALIEKRGVTLEEANVSDTVVNKYDSIQALEVLAYGLDTAGELVFKVKNLFDESRNGICLSTIHKAKGLEAERVYVACDSLMPSKLAKTEWQKEQERNLQYVAYTRSKMKLGFISEKEIPPFNAMGDEASLCRELAVIENQVCAILGLTPVAPLDKEAYYKARMETLTDVDMKPTGLTVNVRTLDSPPEEKEEAMTVESLMELAVKKDGMKKIRDFLRG